MTEQELQELQYRLSPEGQQAIAKQNRDDAALVKSYKEKVKHGPWINEVNWQRDINLIDLKTPKDKITPTDFPEAWKIAECNLTKLVSMIRKDADKFYPIQDPFKNRGNRTSVPIAKLFEFVDSGGIVYPPIINFVQVQKSWRANPFDGNHRIGMARFLQLDFIPIVFEKQFEEHLLGIGLIHLHS
jgi:hypothetical protein